MAKRKRLTPALGGFLDGGSEEARPSLPAGGPHPAPIAQVAGDAAARAALDELSAELQGARADGRLIERLPLGAIDEAYLVRDRMEQAEDEMEALMASLTARGQQAAVEVALLPGEDGRYGLIAGWRRLTALRRLHAATGEDRFATIKARVVAPETAQAAYVAMVEENEIRVNLSFYERARIAMRALREGIYPTQRAALQGLFGSTTRSRRSKIGSFIPVVEAFDDVLRHPTAISERLGLALSREILRSPDFVAGLRKTLAKGPERNAGEEMQVLVRAVEAQSAPPVPPAPESEPAPEPDPDPRAGRPGAGTDKVRVAPIREEPVPGIAISFQPEKGRIELRGPGADAALFEALKLWLAERDR